MGNQTSRWGGRHQHSHHLFVHLQNHSCGSPPGNLAPFRLSAKICSTPFSSAPDLFILSACAGKKPDAVALCSLPVPSGKLCTLESSPLPKTPVSSNHTLLMKDPINSSLHGTITLSLGIVSDLFP